MPPAQYIEPEMMSKKTSRSATPKQRRKRKNTSAMYPKKSDMLNVLVKIFPPLPISPSLRS